MRPRQVSRETRTMQGGGVLRSRKTVKELCAEQGGRQ